MKRKLYARIIALILVITTLVTVLPLAVFAEEIKGENSTAGETQEVYIKSVKLAQAKTEEEAKEALEEEGYIFLEGNLNAGTDADGIWLGYTITSDPSEAIYDMKLMNMKGGYTLTSLKDALAAQESAFAEMANDLSYLIDEFVTAYEEGSVPAAKAYKALNFFRVVDGETELVEEYGLGYQIVHGNMTTPRIIEILMLCDATIVDSIVKILTNNKWTRTRL